MSSASPSRTLVSKNLAESHRLPGIGEIFAVRFSQDLFGPGSEIETCCDLPSRATRYNYHLAIHLSFVVDDYTRLTILPMPAYSSTDPVSGLSSTSWLLAQSDDFQRLHIPVPYQEDPTHPHPPFPTPARFGLPLQMNGWKNNRPIWVQALPQVAKFKVTTMFKTFEPPVILSKDELWRIVDYCKLRSPPVVSGSRTGPPARTSLALQTLYANAAVKDPLADLTSYCRPPPRDDCSYYSSSSDDGDWEDNMDPITFARYYAASSPHLAEMVEKHDRRMREEFNQRIESWVEDVQSVASRRALG